MTSDIIRTDAVSKQFGGKAAVRGVSLQVERGSVYAFLGPNGAGKSTTIRLMLGLLRPTSGSVALFGLPLDDHRASILARTGSLVENPGVYPHLTARENLEITRRILGAPRTDIDRVLAIVGLEKPSRNLVKTYSLGMKQRLGLAQAMLGARELLMLDEPTNGLDPAGMSEMRTLIRELPAAHGITVFLSSHLLTEVEQVATHVGILSQGTLVFQGTAAELTRMRKSRLRIRIGGPLGLDGLDDRGLPAGADRLDAAVALLAARGWTIARDNGALVTDDTSAAAAINRALVEAGHEVRHLAIESATLEDVFLGMTQAEVR